MPGDQLVEAAEHRDLKALDRYIDKDVARASSRSSALPQTSRPRSSPLSALRRMPSGRRLALSGSVPMELTERRVFDRRVGVEEQCGGVVGRELPP
jgi:hypothetical protein